MTTESRTARLMAMADALVAANADFHKVLGPGAGDHATNAFMAALRTRAVAELGEDYSEKRLCGETAQAVDFYIPTEETIIEVALGLQNPASEFEKDVLKAIIAQESGSPVSRLIFIARPGGARKCQQPGRAGDIKWAQAKHGLQIEVHDLPGEPRPRRVRRRKPRDAD